MRIMRESRSEWQVIDSFGSTCPELARYVIDFQGSAGLSALYAGIKAV